MRPSTNVRGTLLVAVLAGSVAAAPLAQAVPSFARQTGLSFAASRSVFPELAPSGACSRPAATQREAVAAGAIPGSFDWEHGHL